MAPINTFPGQNVGGERTRVRSIYDSPRYRGCVWGERGAAGFFEDIHVLIVVVLGMSILLGSLAAAFTAHTNARDAAALRADAARILREFLADPDIVHAGEPALLDLASLESLNSTGLARFADGGRNLQLVVSERSGEPPRTFVVETGPLGPWRASASTAASLWHSDLDVRAARITVTLGGS